MVRRPELHLRQFGYPADSDRKVYRLDVAAGRRELWKEFSLPDATGVGGIGCSAITPDGKAFVFTCSQQLSDLYVVDGLK